MIKGLDVEEQSSFLKAVFGHAYTVRMSWLNKQLLSWLNYLKWKMSIYVDNSEVFVFYTSCISSTPNQKQNQNKNKKNQKNAHAKDSQTFFVHSAIDGVIFVTWYPTPK